ncbi:hypothetical protein PanWU01x14_038100 [Parasponia andersonii]|uniref:Uncharacterized protein n=1 Tax=Parasponia andersonii TaxID=3476 RepID=A0A2P5DS33_PARAD|nr:hypothetical protein PanWU01x14_038100 [Parasponia andersonii]
MAAFIDGGKDLVRVRQEINVSHCFFEIEIGVMAAFINGGKDLVRVRQEINVSHCFFETEIGRGERELKGE